MFYEGIERAFREGLVLRASKRDYGKIVEIIDPDRDAVRGEGSHCFLREACAFADLSYRAGGETVRADFGNRFYVINPDNLDLWIADGHSMESNMNGSLIKLAATTTPEWVGIISVEAGTFAEGYDCLNDVLKDNSLFREAGRKLRRHLRAVH